MMFGLKTLNGGGRGVRPCLQARAGSTASSTPSPPHALRLLAVTFDTALINHLTPNDPYMDRTAPLTSKRCILYIYSTNIVLNVLNMLYTLRLFLFKMQFVS